MLALNQKKQQDRKHKIASLIVAVIFAIGLAYPTSINGQIFENIYRVTPVLIGILLLTLILVINRVRFPFIILFLIINSAMWSITLFNSPTIIDYGNGSMFTVLTLLFIIDFKKIEVKQSIFICFKIVSLFIIIIGWGMILKNAWIDAFFIKYYSDFYPVLVPIMLEFGKPVIVFGTHSVAAFYMFIFFFLNIKTYEAIKEKKYYLFSINFLVFCYMMDSNTGIFLLLLGLFYLFYKSKRKLLWVFLFVITGSVIMLRGGFDYTSVFVMFDANRSGNGFLGRFSTQGNLQGTINYILTNPFSATGYSADKYGDLTFYDSGIISTILRGTVVFALIFYIALYLFFKRNIINKRSGIIIFLVYFLFEIGFNNLFYFRTLFILPFIILYLNFVEIKRKNEVTM